MFNGSFLIDSLERRVHILRLIKGILGESYLVSSFLQRIVVSRTGRGKKKKSNQCSMTGRRSLHFRSFQVKDHSFDNTANLM